MVLEHDGVEVKLNYPRDAASVWFATEPEWLSNDLNGDILSGRLAVSSESQMWTLADYYLRSDIRRRSCIHL